MEEAFLALVRLGIGNAATEKLPNHIEWDEVEALAEKQGMLGIVYDGLQKLRVESIGFRVSGKCSVDSLPSQVAWLRILGKVIQGYEQRYVAYKKAVTDLAAWYHAHGYRMMLLKGLACGLDWPKPKHRPYGDIDIWLFGRQQAADKEMVSSFRIQDPSFKIDNSHHHHTVFQWQDFTVENHYDFVNVHHHKSNVELERIFKSLSVIDSHSVELNGEKVFLPSPNLHALFLIKHLASHFSTERITIRQVLDWGFFVEKHGFEVDWKWLRLLMVKFHMDEFFDCINLICVEDLRFDKHAFYCLSGAKSELKERILYDILKPEFSEPEPKHVWKRIPFKYRRWKANEWKHELCYNESMRSSFWSGVKNHLLKPAQI